MARMWNVGSGLRSENIKKIGTSRFAVIFQIIEKQYFEELATKKSMDKAGVAPEKLLTSNLYH